jgi:DNA-binding LacI/PurR family transcriptional regulator
MIQSNCVQGVIIKDVEWQHAVWVRRIAEHVPVVVLGVGTDAEYIGVNSVLCDNALAMHNAVSFVKSLGHQRVAFFNVVNQGSSVIHHCQRGQGFRAALNRLGMLQHPDYFQEPEHNNAIESMDAVAKRVLEYWLAMGDERPTAIIGVSDAHAMAMMQASYQLGLDIPGDMTVIGCMNTPDAQLCRPALTSVGFPGGEIGRMAVDLLLDVIENPSQPHRQLLLGAEVIERQSHRAC